MEQELEPVKIAKEIADQVDQSQLPEQYRVAAFRAILEHRLGITPAVAARMEAPGFPGAAEEMSFSEFLNQLGELRANPQRFAAVAFYYERHRGERSVTQENIINSMTDASLRSPANFTRDMRVAASARNALLMQAREQKDGAPAWQLTRTGRTFIEQRLSA